MARLMSDAKKGFYATNTSTVGKIIDKVISFKEEKETIVVDSCCGEGEVLEFISKKYPCKAYGVELDSKRAQIATGKSIVKVLNGDSIYSIVKNTWWAGLNFLNPPYGTDSEGSRLETKFVKAWGGVTSREGIMILAINPSSLEKDMVETLVRQGYKIICSIYDKDNEDYKNFQQFFMILQRKRNFRENKERLFSAFEERVEIEDLDIEKVEITTGGIPQSFREIITPKWKIDEAIKNSTTKQLFNETIEGGDFAKTAIEQPNDGQAAILIASGIIDDTLKLKINGLEEEVVLKGTVFKYQNKRDKLNSDGEVVGTIEVDAYKTELYALSVTNGEYVKCV